jgi:hypothetical protein
MSGIMARAFGRAKCGRARRRCRRCRVGGVGGVGSAVSAVSALRASRAVGGGRWYAAWASGRVGAAGRTAERAEADCRTDLDPLPGELRSAPAAASPDRSDGHARRVSGRGRMRRRRRRPECRQAPAGACAMDGVACGFRRGARAGACRPVWHALARGRRRGKRLAAFGSSVRREDAFCRHMTIRRTRRTDFHLRTRHPAFAAADPAIRWRRRRRCRAALR